ncbi:predicted protein [Chaetoceros tenuissimus]|uniref:Uncharacterized protein n=1 Tax=Chaetoceros tenuissimus TaxID=426638 RepID=A0AAD3CUX0_9STRA|nr:predicted protein [Chaetoceros tenuissimus]
MPTSIRMQQMKRNGEEEDNNEHSSSTEESSSDESSASTSSHLSVRLDLLVQNSINLKKSHTSVVNLRKIHGVHRSPQLRKRDTTNSDIGDIGVSDADSSSNESSDEDSNMENEESEMYFEKSNDLDFRQFDDDQNHQIVTI